MSAKRIVTLLAVVMLAACSDSTGPRTASCSGNAGPPWPATISGCWTQMGVDTYTELDLAQQDTIVTGTLSFCGPIGGCTISSNVTGTVLASKVRLQWSDQTTAATLVSTSDTLTNDTTTTTGSPGIHTASFVRRTWR